MDDFNSSRWKHDSTIFAGKIRALGNEVIIRICDSDTALQHKQAQELIDKGASVLVIVPANSLAASAIVRTAGKQNVPVIAYDRLILDCPLDYYISFDAEKVGVLQAEYILKSIHYKGSIMIMNGPEYDINSLYFKKGQMSVLQPYIAKGEIKIIYDRYLSEWTSMEAFMEGNDFLATYDGPVDGIIAANDELAQGIIDALTVLRPGKKFPITGQDATVSAYYNILDNLQGMTVYKPIDSLAAQAAELACRLAAKKDAPIETQATAFNGLINVPFIQLDPIAITKENIQTLLIKSSYLSDEYLKGKK
jgi:D-xylose transport system substrate-binding protein